MALFPAAGGRQAFARRQSGAAWLRLASRSNVNEAWRTADDEAGAKVLIVDDNAGIRRALTLLLDVNGIGSVSVAGPEEALEAIATQDIGVVIQDMNYSEDTTG